MAGVYKLEITESEEELKEREFDELKDSRR
jgi:hypothetical protein